MEDILQLLSDSEIVNDYEILSLLQVSCEWIFKDEVRPKMMTKQETIPPHLKPGGGIVHYFQIPITFVIWN